MAKGRSNRRPTLPHERAAPPPPTLAGLPPSCILIHLQPRADGGAMGVNIQTYGPIQPRGAQLAEILSNLAGGLLEMEGKPQLVGPNGSALVIGRPQ